MDREKRARAADIGDAALAFDVGPEREACIERLCGGDADLAEFVREYLSGSEEEGHDEAFARYLGHQVGRWTLKRVLGSGGFGVVFLAERENPAQRAAIKLLHGTVHSRDTEVRFKQEQQALAKLNHPYIVHLKEGGGLTDERQPYLVMEYIDGAKPIDAYCRDNRLTTKQSIELFQKVCEAVSSAHQNLILHRDLKPANILVAKDGTPKLVDFNLAKLLDPSDQSGSEHSRTRAGTGTGRYMSPEQVRGEEVKTTTDVYSLGFVLYETLTGTDPYDFDSRLKKEEIEKIICGVPAELPSEAVLRYGSHSRVSLTREGDLKRLRRELSGDLDAILQTALRKEPDRRYQSVDQFRDDLQRHLNVKPVNARPDSVLYQAALFVRRNPAWTFGVTAVSLSLMAGLTGTAIYARRAVDAATTAREAARTAQLARKSADNATLTALMERERAEHAAANARTMLARNLADQATATSVERPDQALGYLGNALRLTFSAGNARDLESTIVESGINWTLQSTSWVLPIGVGQHNGPVRSAVFSPDGRRIVTASDDNTARILDADTGKPVGLPLRHNGPVHSAAFSPDGLRVLTVSEDKTARIWDAKTGNQIGLPLSHADAVNSAAFSADSLRVVTTSLGVARIWDSKSGKATGIVLRPGGVVDHAEFSPDGRRVITAEFNTKPNREPEDHIFEGSACIWDVETGELLIPALKNDAEVVSAVFSADGHRVLTLDPFAARIWDAVTGKQIGPPLHHGEFLETAAFSPDGSRVITGSSDKTARVWDAATSKQIGPPLLHEWPVNKAVFSADGRRVVTVSSDKAARIWDAQTMEPIGPPIQHDDLINSAAFSPDGRHVVTASDDNTVRIWDADTSNQARPLMQHDDHVNSAVFSPDGRRVLTASNDHTARIWDTETGQPIAKPLQHAREVILAVFSPDGHRVVTVSEQPPRMTPDGQYTFHYSALIWDARTSRQTGPTMQHDKAINFAAFSPDGHRLVTASSDKTARIWDAGTGKEICPPLRHDRSVDFASFSPDGGRVVTASYDYTARIWDAHTGKEIGPPLQHDGRVNSAIFSPDGRRVITASYDHTARIWDAETGKQIGSTLRHDDRVPSARFSPDGRRAITASYDRTARIWDAETGKQIGPALHHDRAVRSALFSPDGRHLITASDDGSARIWDADTGKEIGPPLQHDGRVNSATFSPDGRRVVTASDDGTARVFVVLTGLSNREHASELAEIAEAVGGYRLNDSGTLVVIPVKDRIERLQAFRGSELYHLLKIF